MFRLLGYLILALFGITLIRMVIGVLAKMFTGSTAGEANPKTAKRRSEVPAGGVLQKDPVCGTFVAERGAVKVISGGVTHFFCSEECARKFKEIGSRQA